MVLRGLAGRAGRITTRLLLSIAKRDFLFPTDKDSPKLQEESDDYVDIEWQGLRDKLLLAYLEAPRTRPSEFEASSLEPLVTKLRELATQLDDIRKRLDDRAGFAPLAEIALLNAENEIPDSVALGQVVFTRSQRTGLLVGRRRQTTLFLLRMKGKQGGARVFDVRRREWTESANQLVLKPEKAKPKTTYPEDRPWPIRGSLEETPKEIAATLSAFEARCKGRNATDAYTECAEQLSIKGDESAERIYILMRRLVTTLRREQHHDELRFLAHPSIDIDQLINEVHKPDFRELV